MVQQYTAIGIATTVWTIQKREDVMKNLQRISKQIRAMKWGIYTPPTGWKPYTIPKEVVEHVEKAATRSR